MSTISVEANPFDCIVDGMKKLTTIHIIHVDIPPFDLNTYNNNEPIIGDVCILQDGAEEEIYPMEKNPFSEDFDSHSNNEDIVDTVYANEVNSHNSHHKSPKQSSLEAKKFPAFKSKNHNFNPFGSDTEEESDVIPKHSRKVLEQKKDYFYNSNTSELNSSVHSEPEVQNKPSNVFSTDSINRKKHSMVEESIYDGTGSIYSTCKRRAPIPPKLSDKEKIILELIDLNSQLTSLEGVSQKINEQLEERESEYMEFNLEHQSLIDNRNYIISKKFDLYHRLAELCPFDKRVLKLKKIVSKKKSTNERSTPLFKWRCEKEREAETQYLYEMKSAQRCYSTHLERKHISRPKLSNILSTISRSSSVYGSNRSLSFISAKFDSSKTNQ